MEKVEILTIHELKNKYGRIDDIPKIEVIDIAREGNMIVDKEIEDSWKTFIKSCKSDKNYQQTIKSLVELLSEISKLSAEITINNQTHYNMVYSGKFLNGYENIAIRINEVAIHCKKRKETNNLDEIMKVVQWETLYKESKKISFAIHDKQKAFDTLEKSNQTLKLV